MKYISPSLLALAAIAAVPSAYSLDVRDDNVRMGLRIRLQARAEISQAKNTAGNDFAPVEAASIKSDTVDFYLRRARIGFVGTWKGSYFFNATIRADGSDRTAGSTNLTLHDGFLGYKWGAKEDPVQHAIQVGRQIANFNTSNIHSSASLLLANAPSTGHSSLMSPRGAGVKYTLTSQYGKLWLDLQNNIRDSAGTGNLGSDNADGSSGEGMFYSARVDISPPGEWNISSSAESYAGKPGKGILVGLDYGSNNDDRAGVAAAGTTTNTTGYGINVLFRMDGLTALAEYRTATADTETGTPAVSSERKSEAWRIQAGYAVPMGDGVIEPAIRYSKLDINKDDDEEALNFSATSSGNNNDYGLSGTQIEVGVNYYITGNNNKFQFAYLNWKGEDSTVANQEAAKASIFRAQWQLNF